MQIRFLFKLFIGWVVTFVIVLSITLLTQYPFTQIAEIKWYSYFLIPLLGILFYLPIGISLFLFNKNSKSIPHKIISYLFNLLCLVAFGFISFGIFLTKKDISLGESLIVNGSLVVIIIG